MKKLISILLTLTLLMTSAFALAEEINVISREDGSGTRGAFIELFGIEQKNEAGDKIDYTTDDCDITNSTSVMMTWQPSSTFLKASMPPNCSSISI